MVRRSLVLVSALCLLATVVRAEETEDIDDSNEKNVYGLDSDYVEPQTRIVVGGGAEEGWGYSGEFSPENWSKFGHAELNKCAGTRQSPVNIVTKKTVYKKFPRFEFDGYRKALDNARIVMSTTGAGYKDIEDTPRYIHGGPLVGRYQLAGFHIHWGANSREGSEHKIDNKAHAMELHLVHFNIEYGSVEEALKHGDGIAVLGIMFEEHHGWSEKSARRMAKQLSLASGTTNNLAMGANIKLNQFIQRPERFYHYQGSLTTPMCNEAVQWIVFPHAIKISRKQMNRIRALRDPSGHTIEHNFRPVQDIKDRTVYKSFK